MNRARDRADPPGFGAVGPGECEIFSFSACAQRGRGDGGVKATFGTDGHGFRISQGTAEKKRAD